MKHEHQSSLWNWKGKKKISANTLQEKKMCIMKIKWLSGIITATLGYISRMIKKVEKKKKMYKGKQNPQVI